MVGLELGIILIPPVVSNFSAPRKLKRVQFRLRSGSNLPWPALSVAGWSTQSNRRLHPLLNLLRNDHAAL